jgi:hypothetical protein
MFMRMHSYESFIGLGLIRQFDKLTVLSKVEGQAHYKPEVWVLRSVMYRNSSPGFVCRISDQKRPTMTF